MSSMKQVVYTGAFGALVAMQGCGGEAETQQVVTPEGHTLKQDVTEIIETAKEQVEKFDAHHALKQVQDLAKENDIDFDSVKEHMGDFATMDPNEMATKAKEAFEKLMAGDDLKKGLAQVKGSVQEIFASLTAGGDMTFDEAKKTVKDFCKGTKKAPTPADARDFVKALGTFLEQCQEEYSQDVHAALADCKPRWQFPCNKTIYNVLSPEEIKKRQNIDSKNPKDINKVMPTKLDNCSDTKSLMEYIAEQVAMVPKVDTPTLKTLAGAVTEFNQKKKKKTAAKKAIEKGTKTSEDKKDAPTNQEAPAPAPAAEEAA